jgi:hypothetical protein
MSEDPVTHDPTRPRGPRRGGGEPPTIRPPRRPPPPPEPPRAVPQPAPARGVDGAAGEPGNRKLIRPSLAEHVDTRPGRRPPSAGRRHVPPPEQTGSEAAWYQKRAARSAALVVLLDSGEELRGALEWHDRDCLKLRQADGRGLVVMKHVIVSVREDPAASVRAGRRAPPA